jgi:hypothetical protein
MPTSARSGERVVGLEEVAGAMIADIRMERLTQVHVVAIAVDHRMRELCSPSR